MKTTYNGFWMHEGETITEQVLSEACGHKANAEVRAELWPRPIPVSERLPEVDESTQSLNISHRVLVFGADIEQWIIGRYSRNTERWLDEIQLVTIAEPTHWLPLPSAP
jgi:hypothetical protein